MARVHLDTDRGSDPDGACALAMLLGRPDAGLVGITTTLDPEGRRTGCAEPDMPSMCSGWRAATTPPMVAGAATPLGRREDAEPATGDLRH
ncbi:hypothetical protein [Streptomyces sp. PT12]|uniref:hypothetical protein n=1 Tax=Streptomyces sp. PT12 TaxID=1510197 RepID=UPI000DE47F17|nr:hypothetical protein [Streptomyces sp. PT12]RBM08952.1 hypothetical protein DEH69_23120 [Streptomyces sp. PT12]